MLSECQRIVTREGVIFGPGKVKDYAKRASTDGFLNSADCQYVPPLKNLGMTIEHLLVDGILFPDKQRKKLYLGCVKGWNLNDFLEQSTWPRDSSAASSVRFGMPVLQSEEDIDEDEVMVSAPPLRNQDERYSQSTPSSGVAGGDQAKRPPGSLKNPFVHEFLGVRGLDDVIISQNADAVLFLSAKFCKTCKTLNLQYTRMARLAQDKSNVKFTKAGT
jgi:hypothetical protein